MIPALLQDGTEVDLYKNGAPVDWDNPSITYHQHANMRWRKYMMNMKIRKN